MTLQNSQAALDMGARVLPGGRGCSFKVWAPHGENVRVEVRKGDGGVGIAQETVELKQVRSSVDVRGLPDPCMSSARDCTAHDPCECWPRIMNSLCRGRVTAASGIANLPPQSQATCTASFLSRLGTIVMTQRERLYTAATPTLASVRWPPRSLRALCTCTRTPVCSNIATGTYQLKPSSKK